MIETIGNEKWNINLEFVASCLCVDLFTHMFPCVSWLHLQYHCDDSEYLL